MSFHHSGSGDNIGGNKIVKIFFGTKLSIVIFFIICLIVFLILSFNFFKNAKLHLQRQDFPLEPITIIFEKEYSMDNIYLTDYILRIKKEIYSYLVSVRLGQGNTDKDLKNEEINFVLSNFKEWLPNDLKNEQKAKEILLNDDTKFIFKSKDGKDSLIYLAVEKNLGDLLVHIPQKHEIKIEIIELSADFSKNVLIKRVKVQNPLRSGNDALANSSIDLINRKLIFRPLFPQYGDIWNLTKISFQFSYDETQLNTSREKDIPNNENFIIIHQEDLGLNNLF